MKLSVAGQDRTHDLGRELRRQAVVMERGDSNHKPKPALVAPAELGALFDRVLTDAALRKELLTFQQRRVQRAKDRNLEAEVKALMAGML